LVRLPSYRPSPRDRATPLRSLRNPSPRICLKWRVS
jgi:hypothetical protein